MTGGLQERAAVEGAREGDSPICPVLTQEGK